MSNEQQKKIAEMIVSTPEILDLFVYLNDTMRVEAHAGIDHKGLTDKKLGAIVRADMASAQRVGAIIGLIRQMGIKQTPTSSGLSAPR
jgi:hypothetical protein